MYASSPVSERLNASIRFVSENLDRPLESLQVKGLDQDGLSGLMTHAFLLSELSLSDGEFERVITQGFLPDYLLPIGTMYKVTFGNIRQFLHPDSDRISFRELRGRYLTASVFMEVATSFLVKSLEMPRANRVFWGLGGSLIVVPPHFGPRLKSAILEFNRSYGLPEIGFELTLGNTKSVFEPNGKCLLEPNEKAVAIKRDKLFGWRDFEGKSGEAESEFVVEFARSLAKSEYWCFRTAGENNPRPDDGIAPKLAILPYWIYPADERQAGKAFVRGSYLAELGDGCSFIDTPLAILASGDLDEPITYFRLDISGMRESLAAENERGILQLYEKCRKMELFFRETIPSILRAYNENRHAGLEIALLHSTCDDVILVTRGKHPEQLIEHLVEACRDSVNQKLVFGGVVLKPGHTASDLSHGAMLRLVESKQREQ